MIATSIHAHLITPDKKPTAALIKLLEVCGITHNGSLETIIAATQKEQPVGFLRPSGKERWQLDPLPIDRNLIINHSKALHMLEEIKPTQRHYDYALLHGGTIDGVRSRLAFLIHLWKEGYRWNNLVILTGQRPLDPVLESPVTFIDAKNGYLVFKEDWRLKHIPTTETDMIRLILEQSIIPAAWATIPVMIVDTPLQKKGTALVRPTTIDTFNYWLSTNPIPGSLVAISCQPFIGYQDAVIRRILPNKFTLETVGPQAEEDIEPEVLIDAVARWLYNAQYLN